MPERITTTITDITRGQNDKDGNPRLTVATAAGTFKTAKGSQVAYGISNSEYTSGEVVLTIEAGEIVGASTVDGEVFTGRQS